MRENFVRNAVYFFCGIVYFRQVADSAGNKDFQILIRPPLAFLASGLKSVPQSAHYPHKTPSFIVYALSYIQHCSLLSPSPAPRTRTAPARRRPARGGAWVGGLDIFPDFE